MPAVLGAQGATGGNVIHPYSSPHTPWGCVMGPGGLTASPPLPPPQGALSVRCGVVGAELLHLDPAAHGVHGAEAGARRSPVPPSHHPGCRRSIWSSASPPSTPPCPTRTHQGGFHPHRDGRTPWLLLTVSFLFPLSFSNPFLPCSFLLPPRSAVSGCSRGQRSVRPRLPHPLPTGHPSSRSGAFHPGAAGPGDIRIPVVPVLPCGPVPDAFGPCSILALRVPNGAR